jgi:hypothetical protein
VTSDPVDAEPDVITLPESADAPPDRRVELPLSQQEQRLLAELSKPAPAVVQAVEDRQPSPGGGWQQVHPRTEDPLSPVFREPAG